jgi:hypothetical protein
MRRSPHAPALRGADPLRANRAAPDPLLDEAVFTLTRRVARDIAGFASAVPGAVAARDRTRVAEIQAYVWNGATAR